jgi:hypothetical protein
MCGVLPAAWFRFRTRQQANWMQAVIHQPFGAPDGKMSCQYQLKVKIVGSRDTHKKLIYWCNVTSFDVCW